MEGSHAALWPRAALAGSPERPAQRAGSPSPDRPPSCGGTASPPSVSAACGWGHLRPAGRSSAGR